MRHGRTTTILMTFLLVLGAPAAAFADSGSGSTTSNDTKTPEATTTKPSTDTKVPEDTTTKPSTDTKAPPTTEPTTTTPGVPETPDVPDEPECEGANCLPDTPDKRPTPTPDAPGGGGDLPFTGPGDVLLAVVLALLAGSGGILFLMGASGREQLDGLSRRSMDSPSGFHLAYRELRKQQLDD